jgi:hypothetical protein
MTTEYGILPTPKKTVLCVKHNAHFDVTYSYTNSLSTVLNSKQCAV